MCKILVFAGTAEGYALAEYLYENQVPAHICTATEYGLKHLKERENFTCSGHRMDGKEMRAFLAQHSFSHVVDATHPYAAQVSANICRACEEQNVPYMRVVREELAPKEEQGQIHYVEDVPGAVEFLKKTKGNILVTTGSKELAAFTNLPDYENRVYARVLSLPSVVQACADLGFTGSHLI